MTQQDVLVELPDLLVAIPGVHRAAVFSGDGMLLACSGLERAVAEHWVAVGSGMRSCGRGMERLFGHTPPTRVMAQHQDGLQLIEPTGQDTYLILVARNDVRLATMITEIQQQLHRGSTTQ